VAFFFYGAVTTVYVTYSLGSYLVLSPIGAADPEQKVQWTIETLLRPDDVKQLRKDGEWPVVFDPVVNNVVVEEEDEEEEDEDEEEDKESNDYCESNVDN
jgi:hypothetical protein